MLRSQEPQANGPTYLLSGREGYSPLAAHESLDYRHVHAAILSETIETSTVRPDCIADSANSRSPVSIPAFRTELPRFS